MLLQTVYCALLYFHMVDSVVKQSPSLLQEDDQTGKVGFVCAMYRPRHNAIDDASMPNILTFCACAVVSKSWVLTARLCYVQEEWYVSIITSHFTDDLPEPEHIYRIRLILDLGGFSLLQLNKYIVEGSIIPLAKSLLQNDTKCLLYSFTTPNMMNVPTDDEGAILYETWHMQGGVYASEVMVLNYETCKMKYNGSLSPYKQQIDENTLCLDQVDNLYFEPCAFDRGAPIVCGNQLQGVLVYERELPGDLPRWLPNGCYGNINWSYSLYAEGLNDRIIQWITNNYEKEIPPSEQKSFGSITLPTTLLHLWSLLMAVVLFIVVDFSEG